MSEAPIGEGEPVAVMSHATLMLFASVGLATLSLGMASTFFGFLPLVWPLVGAIGAGHIAFGWVTWRRSAELMRRNDVPAVQARSMWLSTAIVSYTVGVGEVMIGLVGLFFLFGFALLCGGCLLAMR